MISKILSIVFGLIINLNIYCQENIDNSKCNLETIKNLRINKDSITDKLVMDFLFSMEKSCHNNVEWSEASNWTLYWLADIETQRFIKLLKSNRDKIDTQLIIDDFKQPVNDGIDLAGIHKKIADLNDNDEIVTKILDSIKSAAKGLGIDIK
ncbi:hypothetical protein [Labilibaculum sp.]|uniref:hypothetical protein n=1 Tax=Labilibaculum sp. TaxID=2060723 RepID=UPI002AA80FF8|nr:hypothetical protein [Labilibaculum sp.]